MHWSLWLYSLLVYLARPFYLLAFVWRSRADVRYRQRLAERLAYQTVPPSAKGGIVVHAVSMGEVVAATPLIERLLAQHPQLPIIVTCMSPTGSQRIQQSFGDRVQHYYLPLDTPGASRRFLDKLQPQLLVLLETEIWPNLIAQAHRDRIPVLIANARLSARSARGYRKVLWLIRPVLAQLTAIAAQDLATARRFNRLAGRELATVCGNLKFEMRIADDLAQRASLLTTQWQRPVWVAGSTHAGEDELVLDAFVKARLTIPNLLLILVPRHPERFQSVADLLATRQLPYVRRSLQQAVQADTHVLLGDTMGELMLWYQAADFIFIGGSLIERGGHNPLEAMCLGKPVISGPHVFNFAKAFAALQQADAVRVVHDAMSLADTLVTFAAQPQHTAEMARRGLVLYQQQGGAAVRTLELISSCWRPSRLQLSADAQVESYTSLPLPAQWQQVATWQALSAVTGQSTGRNTVYFVKPTEQSTPQWVLRHYYRGGLVGKFNRDWFAKVPVAQSRAFAECRLLQQLRLLGLPVPEPVAARYQPLWGGFSADILIKRIDGATDLCHLLQQQALTAADWQALGALIARFHRLQVWHSDLNCHNILRDEQGRFYLIDFDKCGIRQGTAWQAQTLARLLRSFEKEANHYPQFAFDATAWQQLLVGYQAH